MTYDSALVTLQNWGNLYQLLRQLLRDELTSLHGKMEYFLVTDDHCENLECTVVGRAFSIGKLPGSCEGELPAFIMLTADASSTQSVLARGLVVEWW